jgi:hypothetical protein
MRLAEKPPGEGVVKNAQWRVLHEQRRCGHYGCEGIRSRATFELNDGIIAHRTVME